MADWRALYEAALSETNITALEHLVYETEEAMTRRLQELARIAQDSPELDERRAATEQLLHLKVQRLGWPDPLNRRTSSPTAPRPAPSQDYDLFFGFPGKNPVWLEVVPGLITAYRRMNELAEMSPGP